MATAKTIKTKVGYLQNAGTVVTGYVVDVDADGSIHLVFIDGEYYNDLKMEIFTESSYGVPTSIAIEDVYVDITGYATVKNPDLVTYEKPA